MECEGKKGIMNASGKNLLTQRAVWQLDELSLDAVIRMEAVIPSWGLLNALLPPAHLPNKLLRGSLPFEAMDLDDL